MKRTSQISSAVIGALILGVFTLMGALIEKDKLPGFGAGTETTPPAQSAPPTDLPQRTEPTASSPPGPARRSPTEERSSEPGGLPSGAASDPVPAPADGAASRPHSPPARHGLVSVKEGAPVELLDGIVAVSVSFSDQDGVVYGTLTAVTSSGKSARLPVMGPGGSLSVGHGSGTVSLAVLDVDWTTRDITIQATLQGDG